MTDRQNLVKHLRQLSDGLDTAKREGPTKDYPEGVRTVTLSDTMVQAMVLFLRKVATELETA